MPVSLCRLIVRTFEYEYEYDGEEPPFMESPSTGSGRFASTTFLSRMGTMNPDERRLMVFHASKLKAALPRRTPRRCRVRQHGPLKRRQVIGAGGPPCAREETRQRRGVRRDSGSGAFDCDRGPGTMVHGEPFDRLRALRLHYFLSRIGTMNRKARAQGDTGILPVVP